jgi:uncharacterized protein YcgI (DUF1989 family)
MEHSRVALGKVRPEVGDSMVTNQRRPILTILSDTSPGVHDTLMAACDRRRYEVLGCKTYHRNCTDNMWEALLAEGIRPTETPCPFNLFQNTPVESSGRIPQRPTVSKRGDRSCSGRPGPLRVLLGLPAGPPADQLEAAAERPLPDPVTG